MIKKFYFPLKVAFWERKDWGIDWDDFTEGDGKFARDYRTEIENAFDKYLDGDDMTAYFDKSESAREKIQHIEWKFESVNDCLYGRVDVILSDELTAEETQLVKEWITGQNSDGLGEGFEQQDFTIDNGFMNVSFWSHDSDYRVLDETEFVDIRYPREKVE